MGKVRIY